MSKYSSPDSNINSCLGGWVFWLKSSIKFKSAELFWAENPGSTLGDSSSIVESSIVELLIFGFVEKWDLVMPGRYLNLDVRWSKWPIFTEIGKIGTDKNPKSLT